MTQVRTVCRLEKILRGNIKFFMIRKKYKQNRLCKEAQIHIPNFNEFMNRKRPLPMEHLEKIAKVFKEKPEKLFDPFLFYDPMSPEMSLITGEKRKI